MSVRRARQLRKRSTSAEKRLWQILRSRRLAGYKFRRQRHEGPYYLDFYCLEAKFGVEMDGFGHGIPTQQEHDLRRDALLADRGILVKRIWNHQLATWEDRQNVEENLWRILQERLPHPENLPLPPRRREPDNYPGKKPSP